MSCFHRHRSITFLLALLVLMLGNTSPLLADSPKIMVLGFDGVDPELMEKWMGEGKLPNLVRLRAQGVFLRLGTTNPAESPVAWSTFATGKNPGQHRIFGFLKRAEGQYRPQLALARVEERPLLGGWWGKLAITSLAGLLTSIFVCTLRRVLRRDFTRRVLGSAVLLGLSVGGVIGYGLFAYLPERLPYPVSMKEGPSFWTLTGQAGIKTVVIGAPLAFPAEEVRHGRLVAGFGVPDMAGTHGLWFRYSTRFSDTMPTETGGWQLPLREGKAVVLGPSHLLVKEEEQRLTQKIPGATLLQLRDIRNRLAELKRHRRLTANMHIKDGAKSSELQVCTDQVWHTCAQGQWSDWLPFTFRINPLLRLTGMAKLYVFSCHPPELYLSPIEFNPYHLPPNVALSYPKNYAARLADAIGLYPTLGWATATNPLRDEMLTEDAFWEDLHYNMQCGEKMLVTELDRQDWRLLTAVFSPHDRASHMYYRFLDPDNPRHQNDLEQYPQGRDALLRSYVWMDGMVEKAMAKLAAQDILLVLSDHGFAPFRWEVNVNRWLYEEGYLILQPGAHLERQSQLVELFDADNTLLTQIDWSRTRAYALGLGSIYLNRAGREPQGIVSPQDCDGLCREIREKLLQLRHHDREVVASVALREEIYHGPYAKESGDLIVGFHRGYRISWQSTLGNLSSEVISPNPSKWSGDHCSVAPHLIPGILLCNRPIKVGTPHIQDIAPTVLALLHLPIPPDLAGQVLLTPER